MAKPLSNKARAIAMNMRLIWLASALAWGQRILGEIVKKSSSYHLLVRVIFFSNSLKFKTYEIIYLSIRLELQYPRTENIITKSTKDHGKHFMSITKL